MRAEYIVGIIIVALLAAGGAILFLAPDMRDGENMDIEGSGGIPYKEIENPSGFVNTDGITLGELVWKKVILIDFLTYSCINCQRTFPYVNAWYDKYKDQGLEIVGIHTPEFAFEKDIDNVRAAMRRFGIHHPIVLDNDYATWRAYGNKYWPRKYLIDIHGNIVYDHIGEGAYKETEEKIQELLAERAEVLGLENDMDTRLALAAENIGEHQNTARSPETYFGSARNEYFANGSPGKQGIHTFVLPDVFAPNSLYLGGEWNIMPEYAEGVSGSRVVYRYYAGEVYVVAESTGGATVEVYQDGVLVDMAGGEDVNEEGIMHVQESALYKIIKNPEAGEHILELRVKEGSVRLFAFTFG